MLISEQDKTIFIHVQKTGGSSLSAALLQHAFVADGNNHEGAAELLERGIELASYFSFGFVRNPWARLASWHVMFRNNPDALTNRDFWNYHRGATFEEFLTRTEYILEDGYVLKSIAKPQLDYFSNNGEIVVNRICRYENYEDEVRFLEQKLGLKLNVPHLNLFETYDYRSLYTDETAALVADLCKKDIAFSTIFSDILC
jgi:hypothetical protein